MKTVRTLSELDWQELLLKRDANGKAISYKGFAIHSYHQCPIHGEQPLEYQVNHGGGDIDVYPIPVPCFKCARIALTEQALGDALIPKRYLSKTLDSFEQKTDEQKSSLKVIKEFADNLEDSLKSGRCLILCGTPGTGKTHLACGLAREVILSGRTAMFTTVQKLIRKVRASWGTKEEQETLSAFVDIDLLIIDEIGVQAGSESEKNILFDIINSRYEDERSTIIITNCDLPGLRHYLGERIVDRFRENKGRLIQFNGKSYRE